MDAILGVDAIVVPSGPVAAVGITGGFVSRVAEEEMAAIHGPKLGVSVVRLWLGLNKVPSWATSAFGGVLDEKETVDAGGKGSGEGSGGRSHSQR